MALMSRWNAAARLAPRLRHAHDPTRRQLLTALAGAAWFLPGCRGMSPPPPPITSAGAGEAYVRLALSLARHQPSLVDMWLGPAAWGDGAREPVAAIQAQLADLRAAMARMAPPADDAERARRRYLAGQVRALDVAAGRLSGASASFADEAAEALGTRPAPRDAAALDRVRQELSERLPGRGSLAERHAAFRHRHAVPADRVEAVFAAALAWCREATAALLPLPAGERIALIPSDERGWAAFSRPHDPRTSDVWVSRHGGSDVAHLLQLAAHEGTPGHHAQHVLATARLVEARGWSERALSPAFGPHRLLAEGAAEAGAELLLPHDVRTRVCAKRLLPAAGQPASSAAPIVAIERLVAALDLEVAHIAADYLDAPLGTEAATTRLRDEALVLDPDGMLAFIERQRSRVLAYPVGRRLVGAALEATPAAERWTRFAGVTTLLDVEAPMDAVPSPDRK
jgi:hypothetical protein